MSKSAFFITSIGGLCTSISQMIRRPWIASMPRPFTAFTPAFPAIFRNGVSGGL